MQIVNPGPSDYHAHSLCFSDGMNTVDELVRHAGAIGLTELAITDHDQAYLDALAFGRKTWRGMVERWQNVHNDVRVIFGIEADILDETGAICAEYQGQSADFIVLSTHTKPYRSAPETITAAYLNAIEQHGHRVALLGHPCVRTFAEHLDIDAVVACANEHGVALELNCANLVNGYTHLPHLERMLAHADRVYVNSDAHTLHELATVRAVGFDYLREHGWWSCE